jgi:hypothetical protein
LVFGGAGCWVANFTREFVLVEESANSLMTLDCGADEHWFHGVALFNLGLSRWQMGQSDEAKAFFQKASEHYGRQELHPGQSEEWRQVMRFFQTVATWVASGKQSILDGYAKGLQASLSGQSDIRYLKEAVNLLIRFSQGVDVKPEVEEAIQLGASRTYYALILLAHSG